MASLRLLVLDFVRAYIGRWGHSPSYSEIAAATGASRDRVKKSLRMLERDGLILRTPGPRGLALPSRRDDALRLLRTLGWRIDEDVAAATPPFSPLPTAAVLDYLPPDSGKDEHGGDRHGGAGETGGSQAA